MALGNHYAGCAPATAEEAARVRTEKEAAYRQPKITDILLRSRLTDPDTVLGGNHSRTAVNSCFPLVAILRRHQSSLFQ